MGDIADAIKCILLSDAIKWILLATTCIIVPFVACPYEAARLFVSINPTACNVMSVVPAHYLHASAADDPAYHILWDMLRLVLGCPLQFMVQGMRFIAMTAIYTHITLIYSVLVFLAACFTGNWERLSNVLFYPTETCILLQ
jgi:hypothetical protein